jgi:hypothetical protein
MPGPIELPARPPRRWPIAIAVAVLAVAVAVIAVLLAGGDPIERAPVDAHAYDARPVPGPVVVMIGSLEGVERRFRDALRADLHRALAAAQVRVVGPGESRPPTAYLDATVPPMRPSLGDIPCKLDIIVASYPDKAILGLAHGLAEARDPADCLRKAVDDVIPSQVVGLLRLRI